jgi:hypothetical protein
LLRRDGEVGGKESFMWEPVDGRRKVWRLDASERGCDEVVCFDGT